MGFVVELSQKVLRFRLDIWYIPSAVTTSSSIRFLDRLNSSGRGNAGPSKELFLFGGAVLGARVGFLPELLVGAPEAARE